MDITALLSSDLLTRPTGNTASTEGGDFADVMGNLLARSGQVDLPTPPVGAKSLAAALDSGPARLPDTPPPPRSLLAQAPPVTLNTAGQQLPTGPGTETEAGNAVATNPQTDPELAASAQAQPSIAPSPAPGAQQPLDDATTETDFPDDQPVLAAAPASTPPAPPNPALAPAMTPLTTDAAERPTIGTASRPTRANAAVPQATASNNGVLSPAAQSSSAHQPLQTALTEAAPLTGEGTPAESPTADASTRAPAEVSRFAQLADAALSRHATDSTAAMDAPGGNRPAAGATASAQSTGAGNAATVAQMRLSAPVSSPAWQQQLGQQLGSITQRGRHQVELHLNPVDLGPLSVSLKVDEQGAQAQFLSAHATVRAAVEQAIPQLREALAEQGIALGETSVGEQQRQAGGEAGNGDHSRTAASDASPETALDTAPEDAPGTPLTAGPGVDLYA